MTKFQRRARLFIAIFAVGFAVMLAFAFKRRSAAPAPASSSRTDPTAVVESIGGRVIKVKGSHQDVSIEYKRQLTYKDGSSKLQGVEIVTTERGGGRSFTVTGHEGSVAQNPDAYVLHGNVELKASDGLSARTEHATYAQSDGIIRAPGPVEFTRGRLSGSGIGMTYDQNQEILVILDQAHMKIAGGTGGGGATDVTSASATVARRDHVVRFEQAVKALRGGQIVEADSAVAHLSDQDHIETVELRGNSRITAANQSPGALQALTGRDMDLKYGPDGESLEHAVINGDAVLKLAGQKSTSGREISATVLDVTLAPDGATPVALIGRESVKLSFPDEQGKGGRTIKAMSLDARGEPKKGLTRAIFSGDTQPACLNGKAAEPECDVDFREEDARGGRAAKAGTLDVALKAGMSEIEEAKFARNVRFEEGTLGAFAANARYVLDKGILELTGTEPGAAVPHIVNDQIKIDATRIDVTLAGPKMKATGKVSSVLQPAKSKEKPETKMPSMLKGDQVVYVSAEDLDYDGTLSKATYKGGAKLWQTDTSVNAQTIAIDSKNGDLSGVGTVTTSAMLQMKSDKDKTKKERVRSIGTAKEFKYEESARRATYAGDAHLSGPQGDMTADKIELYLQGSGDEIDRAEAYDKLTLREQNRKTTGARMTYTTSNDTYVITGVPVTIVDECGRESRGQKLTFVKATDTVTIDGGGQVRTQTKGGGKCS